MDKFQILLTNRKIKKSLPHQTENSNIDSRRIKTFNDWMYSIKLQISKRLYKSAYCDIGRNSSYYTSFEEIVETNIMKAITIMKIIKRKMNKYDIDDSESNRNNILSIEQWFTKTETVLESIIYQFYSNNNINYKEHLFQIENIIHCYIDYLYLSALFYRNINQIDKTCAYLGISMNVIHKSICLITNSNTLNIMQKTYLLGVIVFMNNNDYAKALEYQEKVIDYCFRELIIKIDYFQGIQDCIIEKKKNKNYSLIFQNISVAFCLRGICKENIGNITKSIEAYKQSKWFANKFLNNSNPYYLNLINKLVERSIIYHDVLSRLIQFKKIHSKLFCYDMEDQLNSEYAIAKSKIAKGQYINLNKLKKTEELIFNLNGGEVNVPSGSNDRRYKYERSNSDYMLSNIRLLNAYRSNEFKDTLYEMKKVSIGYFDIETKEYLQRIIDKISFHNENKYEFKTPSMSNLSNCNRKQQQYSSQPNIHNIIKKKEESSLSDNSTKKTNKTNRKKRTHSQYLKIDKYHSAQKFFTKAFAQKQRYIEKFDNKELTFHKNLLALKTNEKYPSVTKDDMTIEMKASYAFNRLKDNISRNNNMSLKQNLTHKEKQEKQNQMALESTVLKSFNLNKYNELNKALEIKRKYSSLKIMTGLNIDSNILYKEKEEIDEQNRKTLKQINNNIFLFKTHSKSPKEKDSRNRSQLKPIISNEFQIEKKSKRDFDLELFATISKRKTSKEYIDG